MKESEKSGLGKFDLINPVDRQLLCQGGFVGSGFLVVEPNPDPCAVCKLYPPLGQLSHDPSDCCGLGLGRT